MAESVLIFELEWREVPTTCDPCTGCGEIIYGKQYQMFLNTECNKGNSGITETLLCQSCYECLDD